MKKERERQRCCFWDIEEKKRAIGFIESSRRAEIYLHRKQKLKKPGALRAPGIWHLWWIGLAHPSRSNRLLFTPRTIAVVPRLSLSFYSIHGALFACWPHLRQKDPDICWFSSSFLFRLSFSKKFSCWLTVLKDAALNMGRDYNSDISFFFLNSFKTRAFFCNRRNKFVC